MLEAEENAGMLDDVDWEPWSAKLPPLPAPDPRRQQEARVGCGLVLSVIAACVLVTRTGYELLRCAPGGARDFFLPLVYAEAAAALVCLCGLLLDDPGVIPRGRKHSLPVPAEVADRLAAGAPSRNVKGADGRSYCVRCHVWRPLPPPAYDGRRFRAYGAGAAHHCATCGRCVADFDHHCGVFGRCIAGRGLKGNMKYFTGVIAAGYAGAGTATASVGLSVARCSSGKWWGNWTTIATLTVAGYVGVVAMGALVVATCQCVGYLYDAARGAGYCPTCPPSGPPDRGPPPRARRAALELV